MDILATIFIRVILPVFVMVAVGYLAARFLPFDLKTLSRFGLYVLVPCMTFTAMARTTISAGEFQQIIIFYTIVFVLMWAISALTARALKLDAINTSSFIISILFTNCVNVGFPVLQLAYGSAWVERALVYSVLMQVFLQTIGVYLAAGGKATVRGALQRVVQMPGIYAMFIGFAVNALRIDIPAPIFDPLKLVGDSIVPFLLVVLGMQLASVTVRGNLGVAIIATGLRLGVAGLISIPIANAFGLETITRQAMILENSMPTAIFGVALAQEFDAAPDLITSIILVSTLVSIVTLTLWLAIL
ncbi:MAG: AEC family transporter [Chloroflexi bacterium]|nr:AEC family transporter [Chloroflexota bacterium]